MFIGCRTRAEPPSGLPFERSVSPAFLALLAEDSAAASETAPLGDAGLPLTPGEDDGTAEDTAAVDPADTGDAPPTDTGEALGADTAEPPADTAEETGEAPADTGGAE